MYDTLYLQGALRNAITAFVKVSPVQRNTIWSFLEQYDLPVVVAPSVSSSGQHITTQVPNFMFCVVPFLFKKI